MTYQLRPYQSAAVQKVLAHFRESRDSACLVLPTGAGKSLVIAELCRLARGRVLVLAHVQELCEQNYAKYCALVSDGSAGIYSAGLGEKNANARVTFGSVQSVAANLEQFSFDISLLIIDECHRCSLDAESQYARIIAALCGRPSARPTSVLGLTATPYRLDLGYCYERHVNGAVRSDEPRPFVQCIFEVSLRHMIEQGYLVRPQLIDAPIAQYDFSSLLSTDQGGDPSEVNQLLVRHRRVTQSIVLQIVDMAKQHHRRGVMIFAASVDHAREILSYLPEGQAGLVLGDSEEGQRKDTVQKFGTEQLRYLVNVAVLTTGFDAPHVDLIAILRRTASVSLYQQIVGRGLRLHEGKSDCLVVDYAGNGHQLFSPEIGESKPSSTSEIVLVACPACGFDNQFWGTKDEAGLVLEHYGRRCHAFLTSTDARCEFRFVFKECPQCLAENDISARRCRKCQKVLVDPDEMLKDALSLKDALVLRVSGVEWLSSGNRLTVVYHDEDGAELTEYFDFDSDAQRAVFNRTFSRRIAQGRRPLELLTAAQAVQLQHHLPQPDFVVGRAQKKRGRPKWYRVQERVFDYAGRFRTAARS